MLIVLVGPKGSGKTHVGSVLERAVVCRARVIARDARDARDHLPVSESTIDHVNALASRVEMRWSAIIQNEPFATEQDIVGIVAPLLP